MVYQFNGAAGDQFSLLPDYNLQFADATTSANTALNYIPAEEPEDGYSGIDVALRADVFREGAAVNFIVATDEDRDIQDDNLEFANLFADLSARSALVNMILNQTFRDENNTSVLGVDSDGNAYVADGAGGFTVTGGGFAQNSNISVQQDYIDLAYALDGAAWNLNFIRNGDTDLESFTKAFVDVKVAEILEQTALRLIPSDLNADLEIVAPEGGIYTEVIGGQTYDFDITIGNDGTPRSFDLLFQQGQTIGSIPVFIASPYQYGALAVDADGDTLTWSIVDGPDGLAIDEATGVLSWGVDSVVYGLHDVTIRVSDNRGGFDDQTFVLDVNGGEAASISGSVFDLGTLIPTTVDVIVEGDYDPYLAGLPDGSTASSIDVAPDHSPVLVEGLDLDDGQILTFSAQGQVSFSGNINPNETPDGKLSGTGAHTAGDENGISNAIANYNSLVGVFLTDVRPDSNFAPATLDFINAGGVPGGINYTALSPELQQVFFIGDGVTDDGTVQQITVPDGATRLYLGSWDGFGWSGNTGFFDVQVTGLSIPPTGTNLVENGSFETPDVPLGETFTNTTAFPGWEVSGQFVSIVDSTFQETGITFQAQDGNQWMDLEGFGTLFPNEISQEITTEVGKEYVLGFYLGSATDGARFSASSADVQVGDADPIRFTNPVAPRSELNWQRFEHRFVATDTSTKISFTNASGPNNFLSGLDNVSVVEANDVFTVFLDQNRNGLQDDGELSTTTDAKGNYSFENLNAGPYVVTLAQQEGWEQTLPGGNQPIEVSLDSGEDEAGLIFGVREVPLVNTNPRITSTPPTSVVAGEDFFYSPTLEELDGDTLAFDTPLAPAGLVVNPNNGTIQWTPRQDQIGSQNVLLRVRDGRGGFDLQFFQIVVAEPNSAPVITSTPPTGPAGVGLPYTYDVNAVDAQEDAVSFSLSVAPEGMTIDSVSGVITWTPTADQIGAETITVVALDERGLSSEQTFDLTVEVDPENVAPVFLSEAPVEVRLGDNYLYRVSTFDQNGDPTTLTLVDGPDGMTLNPDGLIVWQPGPDQIGDQTVQLTVEDGRGGEATQEFTIEVTTQPVNFPPEITSVPLTAAIAGEDYVFQATAEDRNNDTLFWTLENAPMGMTIDPVTGLINWQPDTDDIGTQDVTVQVVDTYGAFSQLVYTIRVRAVNTPPVILTSPNTMGAVGSTYLYQVGAEDVDQDRLTFSLVSGPNGLTIDADTGLVQWTPDAGQDGSADVEIAVSDSLGASVSQAYTIVVADGQPNQLPVITSTPGFFATANGAYTYQIVAEDPDGDDITYTLLSDQAGMTVNATTGLLEWTPTAADLGTTLVEIVARDPAGGGSIQQFSLTVLDANNAPVINSTPPTMLAAGQPLRYDVLATDADGEFLTYELVSGPAGFVIDGLGRTFWIPRPDQLGDNDIMIRVSDPRGGTATQSFTVTVAADTIAPQVVINLSENPVDVGAMVDIQVRAVDNVGVESLMLTIDGVAVALDANGAARINADTVGALSAVATATDAAGNSSTDTVQIFVADPSDVDGPVISIASPGDGDAITAPTDVIGSVMDDTLTSYRLLIAEFGSRDFREIGSGTENVDAGVLGQIDPTLLRNNSYVLRLEAFDAGGNGSVIEQLVTVDSTFKVGEFELSVVDLTASVNGQQIIVGRTYNSLNAETESEIGFGWELNFRDTRLQVTVEEASEFDKQFGFFTPYRVGTRVYLTLPGGEREGFTFTPIAKGLPGLVYFTPSFTPDPGVTSRLSVRNTSLQLIGDEFVGFGSQQPYNPGAIDFGGNFTLTTRDGIRFTIDADSGLLESTVDPFGNELTYSQSGISSSSGVDIGMEYDAQGRINAIVDTDGSKVVYEYDSAGDLVSATDRLGNKTSYTYLTTPEHYLDEIIDPLGRNFAKSNYDDDGRLVSVTDANGVTSTFAFDPDANIETITDALGNSTTYQYNDQGFAEVIVRPDGGVVRQSFNSRGQLLTQTDPLGNVTTYTYNSNGDRLSTTDALGNVTQYQTDNFGNLTSATDALGNTSSIDYASPSNPTKLTDATGVVNAELEYDTFGNPIVFSTIGGGTSEWERDSRGNVTEILDERGAISSFTYDSRGRVASSEIVADGLSIVESRSYDAEGKILTDSAADGGITTYIYDAVNNLKTVTDALGRSTNYVYGAANELLEIIYADSTPRLDDNPRVSFTYDALGQRISETDESGRRTMFTYDPLGRQTSIIYADATPADDSDNPRLTYEYDLNGLRIAAIDPLGNRTEFEYDAVGNNTLIRDADGGETVQVFDEVGKIVEIIDPLGQKTVIGYDDAGRATSTTFADGSVQRTTYDEFGRPAVQTDRAGNTTNSEFDSSNKLVAVVDALGQRTQYEYDQRGNLATTTDSLGNETSYSYDVMNRATATDLPLGQSNATTYDLVGNVTSYTDYNGDTIEFTYDERNRPLVETWENGDVITYTYLPSGEISTYVDQTGTTSYTYDAQGRIQTVNDANSRDITYQYDDAGRQIAIVTSEGTVSYQYDSLNRAVSVTDVDGRVTGFKYDAASQLIETNFANGLKEVLTYNSLGMVTAKILLDADDTVVEGFEYTYDAAGNRTRVEEANGRIVEFTYDANYRLLSENDTPNGGSSRLVTYTYDSVGNRIRKNDSLTGLTEYSYDANDRLLTTDSEGSETLNTYDANGNLISTSVDGALARRNTWDVRGRLIAVDADGDGTDDATYDYDAFNTRTGEIINGNETQFLVDTNRSTSVVLAEFDAGGNQIASMVYGLGLISRDASSFSFYHTDAQGTVRLITDVNGNTVGSADYDAFGVQIAQSGITTPYGYAGERTLFDGSVDLRARQYQPLLGRFASADPFPGNTLSPLSLHRYLYANANPTRYTDPTGFFSIAELSIGQSIQNTLKALKVPQTITASCTAIGVLDTVQTSIAVVSSLFGFATSFLNPTKVAIKLWDDPTARNDSSALRELTLEATTSSLKVEAVDGTGQKTAAEFGYSSNGVSIGLSSGSGFGEIQLLEIERCGVTFATLTTNFATEDSGKLTIGASGIGGSFATQIKETLKLAAGLEIRGRNIGFEKEFELANLSLFYTPPSSFGARLAIFGSSVWMRGTIPT